MHPILAFLVLAQVGSSGVPGSAPAPAPVIQSAPAASAAAPAAQPVAQAPAAAPEAAAGGGMWQTLLFFGVMILVFWLLIIRPQQKQRKQQETFLGSLQNGDKVVTSAGLIGRIVSIQGNIVTLELGRDLRVQVMKPHVQNKFSEEAEAKS